MIANVAGELSGGIVDLVSEVSDLGVNGSVVVSGREWFDKSVVQFGGSEESWEVKVEQEEGLEEPVDWEDGNDLNREELNDG